MSVSQPTYITIDGTQLQKVDAFKYLGSTISSDDVLDKEITVRIQKASHAMGRLRSWMLQHKDICLSTKLKCTTQLCSSRCFTGVRHGPSIEGILSSQSNSTCAPSPISWRSTDRTSLLNKVNSTSTEAKVLHTTTLDWPLEQHWCVQDSQTAVLWWADYDKLANCKEGRCQSLTDSDRMIMIVDILY